MPLVIKKLSTSPIRLKFVPPEANAGFTVKLPLTACENALEKPSKPNTNRSNSLTLLSLETSVASDVECIYLANEKPGKVEIGI